MPAPCVSVPLKFIKFSSYWRLRFIDLPYSLRMLTMALSTLLLSTRPGWLHRIRETLEMQSQGRVSFTESVAPLSGDWDAILLDHETSANLDLLVELHPWTALVVVAETDLEDEERLRLFSAGVQAVALLDGELFALTRETVASLRALKRNSLSQRLVLHAERMDAVGRTALSVAHDFKHFVQVIQAGCYVLKRKLGKDEKLQQTCQDIRLASDQAHQLVTKLLSFASPQGSSAVTTDLSSFVSGYLPVLNTLQKARVRIFTNLQSQFLLPIDPVALSQILMNLALNAFDAVDQDGKVWLETRDLVLVCPYSDDWVRLKAGCYCVLSVSDNGCGVPTESIERIFEPYFSTKTHQGGSGLGLPSVMANLRLCGGHLALHSRPGLGTTFQVILEANCQLPELPKLDATVLVVDSNPDRRQQLRQSLEFCGARVFEAPNWQVAQQAFPQQAFDFSLAPPGTSSPGEQSVYFSGFSPSLLLEQNGLQEGARCLSIPWHLAQLQDWLLQERVE